MCFIYTGNQTTTCCVGVIGNVNEIKLCGTNKVNSIGNSTLHQSMSRNLQLPCERIAHSHIKYTRCVAVISGRYWCKKCNENTHPVKVAWLNWKDLTDDIHFDAVEMSITDANNAAVSLALSLLIHHSDHH